MLSKIKKLISDKALLSLIFILLINLSFMGYFCHKKITTFVDEGFSYGHANGTDLYIPYISDDQLCRLNPPLFHDQFTVQQEERFTYGRIKDNLEAHPPLFYYIFHTINSFFPDHFTKWTGLSLNLFIFLLTQIALYLLSRRFLSPFKSLLPVIFYGFSVAAICTVAFIRSYMLFTLLTTLLFLFSDKIMTDIKTDDKNAYKNILYFCLTLFFGCLTHYYFLITAFILCAGICLMLLCRKHYKKLGIFALTSLVSVGLCPLLFPFIKNHLFLNSRGIGNSVIPTLRDNFLNHIFNSAAFNQFINRDFLADYFKETPNFLLYGTIFAFICALYTWLKYRKLNPNIVLITVTYILSVYAVLAVTPLDIRFSGVSKRYFFHLTPILALLFILSLDMLTKWLKKNGILQFILIIPLLVCSLQKPDFQVYLETAQTKKGYYMEQLKTRTLCIKMSEPHQDWRMLEPGLYSLSAKNFIIFKDFSDTCFQDLLKDEQQREHLALMVENTGINEESCPALKNYKLYFGGWSVCAYLPDKE